MCYLGILLKTFSEYITPIINYDIMMFYRYVYHITKFLNLFFELNNKRKLQHRYVLKYS